MRSHNYSGHKYYVMNWVCLEGCVISRQVDGRGGGRWAGRRWRGGRRRQTGGWGFVGRGREVEGCRERHG